MNKKWLGILAIIVALGIIVFVSSNSQITGKFIWNTEGQTNKYSTDELSGSTKETGNEDDHPWKKGQKMDGTAAKAGQFYCTYNVVGVHEFVCLKEESNPKRDQQGEKPTITTEYAMNTIITDALGNEKDPCWFSYKTQLGPFQGTKTSQQIAAFCSAKANDPRLTEEAGNQQPSTACIAQAEAVCEAKTGKKVKYGDSLNGEGTVGLVNDDPPMSLDIVSFSGSAK